jgi:hypothetical protein
MAIVAAGPGFQNVPQSGGELADQAALKPFVSPQGFTAAPNSTQVSGSESVTSRMSPYLLRHYQATGNAGGKGFVTFVPIVITGSKSGIEHVNGEGTAKPEDSTGEEPVLR